MVCCASNEGDEISTIATYLGWKKCLDSRCRQSRKGTSQTRWLRTWLEYRSQGSRRQGVPLCRYRESEEPDPSQRVFDNLSSMRRTPYLEATVSSDMDLDVNEASVVLEPLESMPGVTVLLVESVRGSTVREEGHQLMNRLRVLGEIVLKKEEIALTSASQNPFIPG